MGKSKKSREILEYRELITKGKYREKKKSKEFIIAHGICVGSDFLDLNLGVVKRDNLGGKKIGWTDRE